MDREAAMFAIQYMAPDELIVGENTPPVNVQPTPIVLRDRVLVQAQLERFGFRVVRRRLQ